MRPTRSFSLRLIPKRKFFNPLVKLLAIAMFFSNALGLNFFQFGPANVALAVDTGSISGTVTNTAGSPLADIDVTVLADGKTVAATGATDSNGQYTISDLSAGNYKLEFSDPGGSYAKQFYSQKAYLANSDSVAVTAGQTTSNINAQLISAGSITGTVRDSSSAALEHIMVSTFDSNDQQVGETYTSADGTYAVNGLVPGAYRVCFSDPNDNYLSEYNNDKADLASADRIQVMSGQATSGIDSALSSAGHISGTVSDSSESPLSGISVEVYDSNNNYVTSAYTSEEGTYTVGGLSSAGYKIKFFDESGVHLSEYYNDKTSLASADSIQVTAGQTTSNINAQLATAGSISGTVSDGTSELAGIAVSVFDSNDTQVGRALTSVEGTYTVDGLSAGTYRVKFEDGSNAYLAEYYNNKATLATADTIQVTAGQAVANINAELTLPGSISGTVTDASSQEGLAGIVVSALDGSGQTIDETTTADGGTYAIDGLSPGTYKIKFSDESASYVTQYYNNKASLATANSVTVTGGQTVSAVNAQLAVSGTTYGTISGIITNSSGLKSLANAYVAVYDAYLDPIFTGFTDDHGYYSTGYIPSGNYKVLVSQPGYKDNFYNRKSTFESADNVQVSMRQDTELNVSMEDLTSRASVSSFNEQGNGSLTEMGSATSEDGRYVAFVSSATNLVQGDTNNLPDVFVRDLVNNTTERVSLSNSGGQLSGGSGATGDVSISSDGRYVAFKSDATNLVTGDTNSKTDIFVRDRVGCSTQRVSVSSSGVEGNNNSRKAAISGNGRYVAFESDATNLVSSDTNNATDIFVFDRNTSATQRVSVSLYGAQANNNSRKPAISSDGRYVAFESDAANLVWFDTNNATDIFVRDCTNNTTTRASYSSSSVEGNGSSSSPSISSDGRYVAFESVATNLVTGDTNGCKDIFRRDLSSNTTERESVSPVEGQANGASSSPSISADGKCIAFETSASNLDIQHDDTNGVTDIYVRNLNTNWTRRMSVSCMSEQANAASSRPAISADGLHVSFGSSAINLVDGDTNSLDDLFVRCTEGSSYNY